MIDHPKLKSKDTFCILPWIHLNVQPNGDVYPCCMAPYGDTIGNTKDQTLQEIYNGPKMTEIRTQMMNGERPDLCSRCFLIEDQGLNSPRYTHNSLFDNRVKEVLDETNEETGHSNKFSLKYWDFRWSNICNFKCRMCGVYSSSKWSEEAAELHHDNTGKDWNKGTTGKDNPSGIIEFNSRSKEDVFGLVDQHIMDVEEIYFAGGEPLVMQEHYTILEKLIEAGRTDVRLRYNTNFSHTKFKKWDLFGLWQHFIDDPKGQISLFASLDAVGTLAEVIRNGTKWSSVYNNIKECRKRDIEIHFSPTVSLLNMFYIHELIDVAIELNIDPDKVNVNNLLTTPDFYDVRLLPDYLKKELIDKITDYRDNIVPPHFKFVVEYGLKSWKEFINQPFTGDREQAEMQLLKNTVYLDNSRDEDFLEVNPQYQKWFQEIRSKIKDPQKFFTKVGTRKVMKYKPSKKQELI